jgi:AcrR family transcriptional regulator
MNQEPSRGVRTRNKILRAAYSLFLENGFHGTPMREIAQRAGIAVGGIYNHYASKEDIFLAVLIDHHPFQSVLPFMQAAQGETIEEFVRDIASRLAQGMGERMEFIHLLFVELVEFKGSHIPQIYETVFPQVMDFTQRFIDGREELRPIPVTFLIQSFIGLYFSYVMTELIISKQESSELPPGDLDKFVDIFLHGILKETCV